MSGIFGVLRVLSPEADAGQPPPGHWLPEGDLVFSIAQAETSLGRGLHNAIVLFDPTVSREHACLRYEAGAWSVENLSAKSEMVVAGIAVPPGTMLPITPGQTLQMGQTSLQLVAPDLPPSVMALAANDVPTTQSASVAMLQTGVSLRRALRTHLSGWNRLAVIALVVGFCLAFGLVAVGLSTLITQRVLSGGGTNLLAVLMLPLVPVAGVVSLIALIDRYEREPWYLLFAAFCWGAIIAIPPALFIEDGVSRAINALPLNTLMNIWPDIVHSALYGLNAGVTEEAVKDAGLLVLLFAFRDKFENVTDGILYGAIIGAGFGMIENVAYFSAPNISRHALIFLIIGRVILGWLGHSTFTACFGAALGFARERPTARHPWRVPLVGFLIGVGLHSVFDIVAFQANTAVLTAPGSPTVNIVALIAVIADYIPLFVAQAVLYIILMRSLAREAGLLREYLVDEVRSGVVTPDEYVVLQHASVRQRLERALLLGRGIAFWQAIRALYVAEVSLGFVKRQEAARTVAIIPPADSPATVRSRIRHLRRTLARLATPTEEQISRLRTGVRGE